MSVFLRFALLLALASLLPVSASAQFVCGKEKKNGKIKWKVRDLCKIEKGEIPVPLGGGQVHFIAASDETTNVPVSGETPIVLGDGPDTIFQFETTAESSRAAITFSANCSIIAAANDGGWMDIDIVVNGAEVPPTEGGGNRFCALGDEVTGSTGGITTFTRSASLTVAVDGLGPGPHTVTIPAQMQGGPTGAIQFPSLVVVVSAE